MANFLLPASLLLFLLLFCGPAWADDALSRMSLLNRMLWHRDELKLGINGELRGAKNCVQDEYFDQQLDHSDESNGLATFKQRYQANFQYFQANASQQEWPIVFLMIGGEGQIHWKWVCDQQVAIMRLAREHGAIVVQLEHRFFGRNASAGLGDLSTPNLQRLLNVDQALADIASFVPFFNQKNGLKNARWVAFGGSYPGSMAAWLRVKYPRLTVGNVASSAPIWPKVDFWEYSAKMEEAIAQTGQSCQLALKRAFHELAQLVREDRGKERLSQLYHANPKLGLLSSLDLTNFLSAVFGAWQGIVQYSYDQPYHALDNLTMACQLMDSAKNAQQGLYDVFWRVKQFECEKAGIEPGKCVENNFAYEEAIKGLRDVSIEGELAESRAWTWMTCNEFGWYQTTDKENSIFGDIISMNFFYQQCADLFGPGIGAKYVDGKVAKSLAKWGDGCSFEADNLVMPNGRFDPWSMLGIREECRSEGQREEQARRHLVPLWTEEAAHCADMYAPYEGEPKGLELTRQRIRAEVQFYLDNARTSGAIGPLAGFLVPLVTILAALHFGTLFN